MMMPPHLPPKVCDPERSNKLKRIKNLVAITALSLFAGASGASMVLGWIWPKFADGDTWIASYSRPPLSRTQLEDRIRVEMSERIAGVYQTKANSNGVDYLKDRIGEAVIVGSDGWLAMYKPDFLSEKGYYVLSQDGNIYQPEKAVFDKYSGVVYLKIKGQFKVVSFGDEPRAYDDAFVYKDGNWIHTSILYESSNGKIPHLDTSPITNFEITNGFDRSLVVINNQGRVVGISTGSNTILPIRYISRVLPDLLSQQKIVYPSLGIEGWYSEEQPIVSNGKFVQGFAVTKVSQTNSSIKKGDIITEVEGRVVTADKLWYNINNKITVNLKILRNGKLLEISVPVIKEK